MLIKKGKNEREVSTCVWKNLELLNTAVALRAIALVVTVGLLQFLDCGMSTEIGVGWPRYACNIRPVKLGSFEGV